MHAGSPVSKHSTNTCKLVQLLVQKFLLASPRTLKWIRWVLTKYVVEIEARPAVVTTESFPDELEKFPLSFDWETLLCWKKISAFNCFLLIKIYNFTHAFPIV